MARFSDINRADELKAAAVKLEAWRKLDAAQKKAAYATAALVGGGKRANRASQVGVIQPFGPVTNFWYETKILAPAASTPSPLPNEESVNSMISAVLLAVLPGVATVIPTGANNVVAAALKVEFAKVRYTEKGATGTPTTSRITGRPYVKYSSNTISCPYGQSATFTSDGIARASIRASLLPAPATGKVIAFTSQGNIKVAK